MGFFEIISLTVHWDSTVGYPFLHTSFPITKDDCLCDVIKQEVMRKDASHSNIDFVGDIKSVKSGSKKDATRLLELPISLFLNQISNENPKQIIAVIDKPASPSSSPVPTSKSPFEKLKENAKPKYKSFTSKWSEEDVKKFQHGYTEASNKGSYLSHYGKKPSIDDQLETGIVSCLNQHKVTYKGGTGGEDSRAKEGVAKLIKTVLFVHEQRDKLGRGQRTNFENSAIFETVKGAIRSKACRAKLPPLTQEKVTEEFKKACCAFQAFPKRWYRTKKDGDRHAEPFLLEMEAIIDIVGSHLDEMIEQAERTASNKSRTRANLPSTTKVDSSIIKGLMVPPSMSAHQQSLVKKMKKEDEYTLFHLTDEMMGINKDSMVDRKLRHKERVRFRTKLQGSFSVGVFTMRRYGTQSSWTVVCKMSKGDTETSPAFKNFIIEAARKAPRLLSHRQTKDAIDCIARACGSTSKTSKALLMAILPDGSLPSFDTRAGEKEFLADARDVILAFDGDESDRDEMILDMRRYNVRGNTDKSMFETFYEAAARKLELENGTGAHSKRHAATDEETTNAVSYAPGIVSIPQLRRETIKLLEEEGKQIDINFKAPCVSWLYLQLSPNHEHRKTAERYTGVLPYKLSLQRKDLRADHPHAHWVSAMKNCWRHDASRLHVLFQEGADSWLEGDTCLEADRAMSYNGGDDKATAAVGRILPISASAKQSARVIMAPGAKPLALDHNFHNERVVPSAIHNMNISGNPGDSLYSGGPDGNGRSFVSVHDQTLDPSTGLKHAANYYQYLLHVVKERMDTDDIVELKGGLPYTVLLETDGGPDHNLTFLNNIISLLGLFLVGNMDKLTATRCCSGRSFLNVVERMMSNLTLGQAGLSLRMDPNAHGFLLDSVINNVTTMKGVRQAIEEYDDAFPKAIEILQRRWDAMQIGDVVEDEDDGSESSMQGSGVPQVVENDSTIDVSDQDVDDDVPMVTCKVGDEVERFFPGYGKFEGVVESINPENPDGRPIRVIFEDGDRSDYSQEKVNEFQAIAKKKVGEIGSCFIKKFGRAGWFTGEVINILDNGKRMCEFNDTKRHPYSVQELEVFSRNKLLESPVEDAESESEYEEGSGGSDSDLEIDEADTDEDGDPTEEAIPQNTPAPRVISKQRKSSGRNFIDMLTRIPVGTTLESHLQHLKERPTAREAFASAMKYPIKQLEDRYSKLTLDGRPVQVLKYATEEDCNILTDAVKKFEPAWDPKFRSMSQLNQMPLLKQFLACKTHFRKTEYTVEFRVCAQVGCDICSRIGRTARTPNVIVDGVNIQDEVLRFMTLPVPNKDDTDHFLPPPRAREEAEQNNLSTDDLVAFIPKTRVMNEEKKTIAAGKKDDKVNKFHTTQVRLVARCGSCGANRVVCSQHMVNTKNGPTSGELESVELKLERDGFVCGMDIKGGKFYSRRALLCGHPIESEYYNPATGTKGGRIVTKDICAVCYIADDLVTPNEIRKLKDLGGKTPLTICRGCLDSGVVLPCSSKRQNTKQATQQKKAATKRKLDKVTKSGRRKARST